MSTFAELQMKLQKHQHKKVILRYLVEQIDSEFLRTVGEHPKKTLLADDKVPIPAEAFDDVIADLAKSVEQIDAVIEAIFKVNLGTAEDPPKKVKKPQSKKQAPPAQGEDK